MTIAEKRFCEYQFDISSGFYFKLFDCISKADLVNLHSLKMGFPEEVKVYERFSSEEGYWKRLEKEFLSGGIK
jgi:hypothetical protein